jgi:P22 coat protein - gene protein 5
VANTFIKATRVAAAALGLLEREIVLPGLVWRDAGGDFAGAGGDTISIRVPARTTARTRTLRGARGASSEGTGIITMDDLTETKVDVTLDTDVYNAVPVTDEELTLDITDFGTQILAPQVRAVAEGIENALADEMLGATYATTLTLDTTDPYKTAVDAGVALNKANVARTERFLVVGADMEGVFLKSDHLSKVDQAGDDSALRRAVIGRLAGFGDVIATNALPPDIGFAFHRTAFVLGMRAPAVPSGASFGSSQTYQGLAMRWLRDYDFRNVQDRSLVDVFIGTTAVVDGRSNEVQTATITGSPTGGTFTLTYSGQTTSGIAYNATANTVKTALQALSTVGNGNVSVSGSAGGPYTVTFQGDLAGVNAAAMTASGAGLTGGSSPAVNIATATAGGDAAFVRAVKIVM